MSLLAMPDDDEGHAAGAPPQRCLREEDIALYLDNALDARRETNVRAHIGVCADCRGLLSAMIAAASVHHVKVGGSLQQQQQQQPQTIPEPSRHDFPLSSTPAPGELFAGKYVIEGLLGEGGMGKVLAAHHVDLDRPVAIKIIHSEWARDPGSVRRFVREARAVANLVSRHVACVYDLGRTRDEGLPFIVMERLEGTDLGALIQRSKGGLPVDDAVDYILQAISALKEAHARGIIHRDLKPQNLFLVASTKTIKVLDFGLAKDFSRALADPNGESKLTGVHMLLGSPNFMSPEQIRDARVVDERSDIWSLGATLYQMLTQLPPFFSPNPHVVCAKILSEECAPVSMYRDGVPIGLAQIIRRCLARDPNQRYRTAAELETALEPFGKGDDGPTTQRMGAS
jgi:eukaryotic-like serine/threonine-protein kinase